MSDERVEQRASTEQAESAMQPQAPSEHAGEQMVRVTFAPAFSGVSEDAQHAEASCEVPWSTDWFDRPNDRFNMGLATASIALAMATYLNTQQNDCVYLCEAFEAFGFEDANVESFAHRNIYDESDFDRDPDLAAYGMAHRTIRTSDGKQVPLVVLAVRGTSHTLEWASDANVASSVTDGNYNVEYHEGFDAAADEAYGNLVRYMEQHHIDTHEARMWIVGHSRGGAVSNLIGAFMCESEEYDPAHIFVYGFAVPAPTRRKDASNDLFDGIFSVIDPEDIVARMPLANWGFTRFGHTFYLPTSCMAHRTPESYFTRAQQIFAQFTGSERPTYESLGPVLHMESMAAGLCPTLASAYEVQRMTKFGHITFAALFTDLMTMNGEKGGKKMVEAVKVSRYMAGPFWPFLKPFLKDSALTHARSAAHNETGYLARMMAAAEVGLDLPASEAARMTCFTVHGDLDVVVKDASGSKVASVWKGAVERVGSGPDVLAAFWNDDLQATSVWMPLDSVDDYTIELRDRDGHSFGVTIAEQDAMGYTHAQDEYGPVKIGSGATFAWAQLAPRAEVRHTSKGRNLRVSVRTEGAKHCDAVGAVCLTAGDWAIARAYEGRGAKFKGWFAEGRDPKVAKPDSTSRAYRMRVAENRSLVAVFK